MYVQDILSYWKTTVLVFGVCFTRHEAEAFETFQEYETIAFRQTRDKIKAL